MDLRTGTPYWLRQQTAFPTYAALNNHEAADVVVIGAGITGALVAMALSDAGANVVVVDKRAVGCGSSAATTGLLMHETDSRLGELRRSVGESHAVRAWRLGLSAIEDIEVLVQRLGDACGFIRRPSFYLATDERDARTLVEEAAIQRGHGFDVDWLDRDDVERLGFRGFGALRSGGNAVVDCFRLTHRLIEAVTSSGGRVYERTTVAHVEATPTGVRVHTEAGAVVTAHRVVWAAGYEGVEETQQRVGRMHSTWVVASEPIAATPWTDEALIWETARPYLYARTTGDGRVIVGGEDERFSRRHASTRRLEKKSGQVTQRLSELVPGVSIDVAYAWGGAFLTTKDGLPYIGSVPEHPHAWLALGYGGNGITFSAIAANLIRDAWLHRPSPDAQIFAFDR